MCQCCFDFVFTPIAATRSLSPLQTSIPFPAGRHWLYRARPGAAWRGVAAATGRGLTRSTRPLAGGSPRAGSCTALCNPSPALHAAPIAHRRPAVPGTEVLSHRLPGTPVPSYRLSRVPSHHTTRRYSRRAVGCTLNFFTQTSG